MTHRLGWFAAALLAAAFVLAFAGSQAPHAVAGSRTAPLVDSAGSIRASAAVTGSLYLPAIAGGAGVAATPSLPTATAPVGVVETPTATPTPAGVDILDNHAAYMDGSSLYVVGEVINRTGSNVESLQVMADVFNQGQLVDAESTSFLNPVAAGDKACFKIGFWPAPANWDSYNLTRSYKTGGTAALGLNALNDSGKATQFDDYEIVGQVRNNGTQKATLVEVFGTLYDANGTVVDCGRSYTYMSDLNPGETSSFKVTFSQRATYGNVAGYHLYVQGWPTTLSLAILTPPDRDVLPKHSP